MAVKPKTRAKAETFAVPQDDAEADALLKLYGERANDLTRLGADCKDELARVKAKFQDDAAPIQTELKQLLKGLQAWAGANRKRLTDDGKVKSHKMPAGLVGWRDRPASVRFKGKADELVARIRELGMKRFLRISFEPDKQAMLKDPEAAQTIEGVTIASAGEDFYVAPFGAELAEGGDE